MSYKLFLIGAAIALSASSAAAVTAETTDFISSPTYFNGFERTGGQRLGLLSDFLEVDLMRCGSRRLEIMLPLILSPIRPLCLTMLKLFRASPLPVRSLAQACPA